MGTISSRWRAKYKELGDKIRSYTGKTDPITVETAPAEIDLVYKAGQDNPILALQEKTITENGEYTADEGYDGLSKVVVNVESGGENLLPAFIDGSVTEITADMLLGVTSLRDYAFYRDPITNIDLTNIVQIGKYSLAETPIKQAITGNKLTTIKEYAFQNCKSLVSIEIPKVITIEQHAFDFCTALQSVELPEGLVSLGGYAFYSCTKLQSVKLPDSLEVVSGSLFSSCTALLSVVIPKGVKTVNNYVFQYCSALKTVTFKGTPSEMSNNVFYLTNALTDIFVPWAEGEVNRAPWGAKNATIHYGTTKYTATAGTGVTASLTFYTPDDVANIYLEYPNGTKVDVGTYGENFPSAIASGIVATGDSYTEGDITYVGYSWSENTFTFNTAGTHLIYGESASGEKTQVYKFVVS